VNNPAAIRAWQRARHWIGWISPPSVVAYRERDSMNVFDSGEAAFNRVWLGTSVARSGPSSRLRWRSLEPRVKTGFASLPGGPGGSAGTLGGSGLAVSRRSAHPREAVKLVSFLLHAQIESIEKGRLSLGHQLEFYNGTPRLAPGRETDSKRGPQAIGRDGKPLHASQCGICSGGPCGADRR
jgi:ABC-type glycerol-3-phosphate transport system substrate-binding protein